MDRYQKWAKSIPDPLKAAFSPITKAWRSWHDPILNYFDHPITNAYTESLNNLIRVMNRQGRGYSFEALRAKILFTEGLHKRLMKRPPFKRRRESDDVVAMMRSIPTFAYGVPTREAEDEPILGVDISRLTEWIESGWF